MNTMLFDLFCFSAATLALFFLKHFHSSKAKNISNDQETVSTNLSPSTARLGSSNATSSDGRKREADSARGQIPEDHRKRSNLESYQELKDQLISLDLVGNVRFIVGIDFTASNEWQGKKSFKGRNLHKISSSGKYLNPYQKILTYLDKVVSKFLISNNDIFIYGFGDAASQDKDIFNIGGDEPCFDFSQALVRYKVAAQSVTLGGSSSFAPLINTAIQRCNETPDKLHMLVIIADGQMDDDGPTLEALVAAANHPLFIVMIGVGDGPWRTLERCHEWLPARSFDNFKFINFNKVRVSSSGDVVKNFGSFILKDLPKLVVEMKAQGCLRLRDAH